MGRTRKNQIAAISAQLSVLSYQCSVSKRHWKLSTDNCLLSAGSHAEHGDEMLFLILKIERVLLDQFGPLGGHLIHCFLRCCLVGEDLGRTFAHSNEHL